MVRLNCFEERKRDSDEITGTLHWNVLVEYGKCMFPNLLPSLEMGIHAGIPL